MMRALLRMAAIAACAALTVASGLAQEGKQVRLRPAREAAAREEHRWALVIGIGTYDDPAIAAIPFCVQDAQDLSGTLSDSGYEVRSLHDAQPQRHLKPTKNNVLVQAERFLADERIGPDDLVVVYLSCHGFATEDGAYLAASDTWQNRAELTGLKVSWLRDLLKACPAGRKVLILDACHSGLGKGGDTAPSAERINAAAHGSGMVTLASCKGTEKSWELRGVPGQPEGQRSAFTYYLIRGLKGEADRDRDGEVVLSELNRFVYERVTTWARRVGLEQTPVMNPAAVEGEIALVRKAQAPLEEVLLPARLHVESTPAGASVYLGGRRVGETPCDVVVEGLGQTAVEQILRVEKEGYQSRAVRVPLASGYNRSVDNLRLTRLPDPVAATSRPETPLQPVQQAPVTIPPAKPAGTAIALRPPLPNVPQGHPALRPDAGAGATSTGGRRPLALFVAPNGDDSWSGRVAAPNGARTDGPFATLARARDAIREQRRAGSSPGAIVVSVRGGLYRQSQPLLLTEEDSGTAAAPVTYRSYPGETARLTGGSSLFVLRDASGVVLHGLTLSATSGSAITIEGGSADVIEGCTIRDTGAWAVSIAGGGQHSVTGCDISSTGLGAIALDGGDLGALSPSGHCADNNHIHHWGRDQAASCPAIRISGVGARVSHNLIYGGPGQAILFSGNDHVIEYNSITAVCQASDGLGAIHGGRGWLSRGTVIRYNSLQDIQGSQGRTCAGICLDDLLSGTTVYANCLIRVSHGVSIRGGRDNTLENNIFAECNPAVDADARGVEQAAGELVLLRQQLLSLNYRARPWSQRYPALAALAGDEPGQPKGNAVVRNICAGGTWDEIRAEARPFLMVDSNLIWSRVEPATPGAHCLMADPLLVDLARGDLRLRPASPALKVGFRPIPVETIGPYADPRRATWPVAMAAGSR